MSDIGYSYGALLQRQAMVGDRRKKILEAGRALFAVEPFQGVGIRDICARAGIGNGSFFHALDGKVALAGVLYQAACQRRDQVVQAALADWPDDPWRAIQAAVAALVGFMGSDEVDACLLHRLGDAVSVHPLFAGDRDGLAGLADVLGAWAKPMIAVQRIAPVTPRALAVLLWGSARGWIEFRKDPRVASTRAEAMPAADEIAELVVLIWRALQPAAAETPRRRKTKSRTSSTLPAEPVLF